MTALTSSFHHAHTTNAKLEGTLALKFYNLQPFLFSVELRQVRQNGKSSSWLCALPKLEQKPGVKNATGRSRRLFEVLHYAIVHFVSADCTVSLFFALLDWDGNRTLFLLCLIKTVV